MRQETIYDRVPYPPLSFAHTHPDYLATLATLLGMQPTPVEHCRVLELGCASGGNLIPMAQTLPDSQFVGIDLSARQIADGQALLNELQLKNITLKFLDILDVNDDFGQFDYIIAHGVYSWVPPPVQDKILAICRDNLRANGVAYVSYNTYPGWHMLGAVRDMMLYHVRDVEDPEERASTARDFIDFLADAVSTTSSPHSNFLNAYVSFYQNSIHNSRLKSTALLTHDELADINEPLYFHQFAERIAQYDLQYLADAKFQAMLASSLPADVSETLRQMINSTVELEQYMDFLRNRTFRQTLLCHGGVQLQGSPKPEHMENFYVASPAVPLSSEPDIHSEAVEKFRAPGDVTFSSNHPLTKAAMLYLAKSWPKPVHFKDLITKAQELLTSSSLASAPSTEAPPPSSLAEGLPTEAPPPSSLAEGLLTEANAKNTPDNNQDARILGANLLKAYAYHENLLELHVYNPAFVVHVSDTPLVSPIARLQTQHDETVTNMRHERVNLDKISYCLIPYLNGKRDRNALIDILEKLRDEGLIEVQEDGDPVKDVHQARPILAKMLEKNLHQLARMALLIG